MTTLAIDIVHMYRIVNHIIVHYSNKTTCEISQEICIPQMLVVKIYHELGITWNDQMILKQRSREKRIVRLEIPRFIGDRAPEYKDPTPISFERPKAIYSNSSPFGIADDVHRHPEKYGGVFVK